MNKNFSFLGPRLHWLLGAVALAALTGCVDNPNSIGHISASGGGGAGPGSTVSSNTTSAVAGSGTTNVIPSVGGAAQTTANSGAGGATQTATGGAAQTAANDLIHADSTQQVLSSALPQDTAPAVSDAQYQSFIGGINGMGLELFRRKATDSTNNVVFSPVSLSVALSMAYGGARNNTAVQMKQVLGDPFADGSYHHAVNRLLIDLGSRNLAAASTERPQSVELALVNTWYLQRNYGVYRNYLDLLATQYGAAMHLADFESDLEGARLAINQFASDSTKGKIENLVRPGDINQLTRAVLVNALYLNATWKDPYDAKLTLNDTFTTASGEVITAPTMHATRTLGYQQGSNYQAIRIPYIGDALSMLVVLPTEGQFEAVRGAMDAAWLHGVTDSLTAKSVALGLPKFRALWGTGEFNAELAAMGMPEAFEMCVADFTGIASDNCLYIFKALQKAFVGIDEAGTEAAAVSAVVINTKAATPVDATMTVNRPFLFSILDQSGAVLFVGQVVDPR